MPVNKLISELTDEQLDELLEYTPGFSETNIENIKRLSLEKINRPEAKRRLSMKKIVTISIAAALFLLTSTAIFATSGGLEQFLARFNPNFGEFAIAPLYPAYAESEGVRIEAVGAQQIDHIVLVYVAVTDISGENRLTRHMRPDLEIYVDGQIMNGPRRSQLLNFDNATNTAYFEMLIVGEVGMPKAYTIGLTAGAIQCFEHSGPVVTVVEGNWQVAVNSSDLGIIPIVWSYVEVDGLQINRMSLSPFGVQIDGYHSHERGHGFPFPDVRVEFENRLFNTRLSGGGGGAGDNFFSFFLFADAPIDLENVTAVIINGERIAR